LYEDLTEICLNESSNLGASYMDIRFFTTEDEQISVKDDKPERVEFSFRKGLGIRVLVNSVWGFAGTNSFGVDEVKETAGLAVKIAKASALLKRDNVELCPCDVVEASYETTVKIDPFTIPEADIMDILLSSGSTIRAQSRYIKTSHGLFRAQRQKKYFASSEGSRIHQTIVWCGGGVYGVASRNGEIQRRSYPAFDGCFNTGGFEVFEALDLNANSERVGKEAGELLDAQRCPNEITTLVLGPEQMWLQIHESCGHPTELDRALGAEVDSAGMSFLTPDMLNSFMYGSKEVNLVIDSMTEGGLGTAGFDDEGVAAKRTFLVKEGLFVGYQSSRDTASKIGSLESTGSVRSMYGTDLPIIRMTNINLLPGDWRRDELIEDTKEGILIDTIRSWSIDDLRLNFQFGCEMGAMIQNGETREMVKNPTYTGITYEFWRGCDASSKDDWRMLGTPGCGKGRPGQSMYVGHGSGTTRFRNVRVGVL